MSSGCELYCFPCSQRFHSQEELNRHLRDHLQDKYSASYIKLVEEFDCGKCSKSFGNKSDLYSHYAEHYFQSHFSCTFCGFVCMNVSVLTLHKLSCKQVNIVKIANANRENESDNSLTGSAFNQFSSSSYGTWQVVCPASYSSTTYVTDVSTIHCDPSLDSEKLISQNGSYDIRSKIHVCDICSKSFSRRCVLDAHRQKHMTEEKEKQPIVYETNQQRSFQPIMLPNFTGNWTHPRIAHKSMEIEEVTAVKHYHPANEAKQMQNVEIKKLNQTVHESDKNKNARQSTKKIKRNNKKINDSNRKPLTAVDPCLSSDINVPTKIVFKTKPAKNTRRSSVKKSRKRKYPMRNSYYLRSRIKKGNDTPVKENNHNSHKTSRGLQYAHKISVRLQNVHQLSKNLQNGHKTYGIVKNVLKTGVGHPYICCTCNKSFKDSFKLRRHSLIHTGVKAFACVKCDRRFSRKDHLNRHFVISCNENAPRPFSCKNCDKSFKVKWGLIKHSFVHSGIKPYTCHKCTKGFSQKYRLVRHLSSCIKRGT